MRKHDLKITVAQLNPVVGDIVGNMRKIREVYLDAEERGCDLVVTPELSVTGCPLEDLANSPDLLAAAAAALEALGKATAGRRAVLLAGAPVEDGTGADSAVVAFHDGAVLGVVRKRSLSSHGVFSGKRGSVSDAARPFSLRGVKVGVLVGEDVWREAPARELRDNGADLLVSVNASPFRPDALRARVLDAAARRVAETGLGLLYVNQVGGQDEAVFDGASFHLDASGRRVLQLPSWEECVMDLDLAAAGPAVDGGWPDPLESVYRAMMTGLRDYVVKSGFSDVVLGLSGGIDSALAAAVAGDALGAERVHCVRLPSRYTSDLSNVAAEEMCAIWKFDMCTLPIGKVVEAADGVLAPLFPEGLKKLTCENMQARARGYLLMTLSNDRGWLLLSTGNKSEIAVGYATLYGDMCGGFNPLKDVFKTMVFALSRWRNANCPSGFLGPCGVVIPPAIIERPPSAELSSGQKDTDSLPPYDELDAILEFMIEEGVSQSGIVGKGFAPETVERVYRMFKRAEYKRRQGAPGPGITCRAFACGRRIPVVNGFDPSMAAWLRESEGVE